MPRSPQARRSKAVSAPPAAELALAARYAQAEKADNSLRAYRSDFALFQRWCKERRLTPLPARAETLATFIACEAERGSKPSSIARRLAGIRHAHVRAGFPSPNAAETVKATLRGVRRTLGTAPTRKRPATADIMRRMVDRMPGTLMGLRDRALLLLGFAGALRRSELVALDVTDLTRTKAGLRVHIGASKTDHERQGTTIAIARGSTRCPIKALDRWLSAAKISEGAIFRSMRKGDRVTTQRLSDRAVAEIVKRYADEVGIDRSMVSGHSLRSGFLTSAANRGASIFKLRDVSRHKSLDTLNGYVREIESMRDHAGSGLL
jgi:site-specific recombinase XerD